MANALITSASTGLGASGQGTIMTVLADAFLAAKRNKGRILAHCNTDAEMTPGPHGTARVIVAPSNLTVNDETDGTTPNFDDTVGTYYDVAISEHKSVVFGFTQIAQALDGGRAIPPNVQGRIYSLFNAIEQDVAALAATFTTNVFGTPGVAINQTTFNQARASLVTAQVPDLEALTAFYKPGTNNWDALSQLPNFNLFFNTGRMSPQVEEDFGSGNGVMWKNARHFESQNVDTAAGTTYNFLFHRDALLVAMKELPMSTSPGVEMMNFKDPDSEIAWQIMKYWDQAHGGDVLKIHSLYGRRVGRDEFGALMET